MILLFMSDLDPFYLDLPELHIYIFQADLFSKTSASMDEGTNPAANLESVKLLRNKSTLPTYVFNVCYRVTPFMNVLKGMGYALVITPVFRFSANLACIS